ncbi:MAG: hypothetical protein ACK4S4_06200 [Pyrinomonadaceae bacterium]
MLDTSFVLFFLAMELGRGADLYSMDSALMLVTLATVAVLPFLLIAEDDRPAFSEWAAGRAVISLFGIAIGVMFASSLGVVLPESLRFFPMTALILASTVCCLNQFYGVLRIRPAK